MADLKTRRKRGKRHNLRRASHYDDTKKYEKQRVRTAENKARHIKKALALKVAAEKGD